MTIYSGRKGRKAGAVLYDGCFVCASARREAEMMGGKVDSYEVDPSLMKGMKMLRVNVPELFQDYIEGERRDCDIVMYPFISQCQKPEFLIAFLNNESLSALKLLEEDI